MHTTYPSDSLPSAALSSDSLLPAEAIPTVQPTPTPTPPTLPLCSEIQPQPQPQPQPQFALNHLFFRQHGWGIAACAVGGGVLLYGVWDILAPFLLALIMAYALEPVVRLLQRWRLPRALAAITAILGLMGSLTLLVLLLVPVVTQQLPLIKIQVPIFLNQLNQWLTPLAQRMGWSHVIDVQAVQQWFHQWWISHDAQLIQQAWDWLQMGGAALASGLSFLFLTPLVAFYALLDWDEGVKRLQRLIPRRWLTQTQSLTAEIEAVLAQYLHGQLLVMGLLAVFYTVGLALAGLNLALPIGVFTGLAVFVPYIGFGIGLILALLAAVLQFGMAWSLLMVVGVYGVGQLLEGLYLTPRLLGERIGLHPVVVIFALLAFGLHFGFAGVLVALPATAVLWVLGRRIWHWYLKNPWYLMPK